MSTDEDTGPHQDQPRFTSGASLAEAEVVVIMLHGRGATARGMLDLATEFDVNDVAYVAPQATNKTWYPNSFLAPIKRNEPWLSSALRLINDVLSDVTATSVPLNQTVLLGFSQGSCLASEFIARNARRYGGLAILSGGVIGPDSPPRDYDGSLDGTPVFLGCSDRDPHIPLERVHETSSVFEELDANVTERIYEDMGHTIIEDEVEKVRDLVRAAAAE